MPMIFISIQFRGGEHTTILPCPFWNCIGKKILEAPTNGDQEALYAI